MLGPVPAGRDRLHRVAADRRARLRRGTAADDHVKIGVLLGSLLAALLATVVLRIRNRHYRRICAEEQVDADDDGIPDVYQRADASNGDDPGPDDPHRA